MRKRIAIGVLWGAAFVYGWQFWASMYGFPNAIGPILALAVVAAFALVPLPSRRRRTIEPRVLGEVPDQRVIDGNPLGELPGR